MRVFGVLVRKIVREQWATLVFCLALLGVFFTLGTYLFVTFGDMSMDAMSRMSPELLTGLFGGLFGELTPLDTWLVSLFVHPLVLTLFSVVVVSVSSRSLAGEVDRGTVDLLLSYPVARWKQVAAAAFVMAVTLAAMVGMLWMGLDLGLRIADLSPPPSYESLRWVALNLYVLFLAAAGVGLAISASASLQGRAIGRTLAFLVVSFFVNLIASLWQRVEVVGHVSIFRYYLPQPIVESGAPPTVDLLLLGSLAIAGLVTALVAFTRRDISTV